MLSSSLANSQDCFGSYELESGFCTASISLWSDSTFFWEYGCEGISNIRTGSFSIKQNKIDFKTIEKDSIDIIFDVEWIESLDRIPDALKDSTWPYFYVVDRNDTLVQGLEIVCYNDSDTYQILEDNYNGIYFFPPDDTEELSIPVLSMFLKRYIGIKVPKKPERKSVLKIRLNVASSFLFYPMINYRHEKEIISGLYKENKLIFGEGDRIYSLEKRK